MHDFCVATGDIETGLWCDTCALPARIRGPLYGLDANGALLLGDLDRCGECNPFE